MACNFSHDLNSAACRLLLFIIPNRQSKNNSDSFCLRCADQENRLAEQISRETLQSLRMTVKSSAKPPPCTWCYLILHLLLSTQSFATFEVQTLLGLRLTAACAAFLLLSSHYTSLNRANFLCSVLFLSPFDG